MVEKAAISDGRYALYLPIVAENDNTDVVSLQVESHTLGARLELHHLTSLDLGETEDSGDTITDGDDSTEFLQVILQQKKKLGQGSLISSNSSWHPYLIHRTRRAGRVNRGERVKA